MRTATRKITHVAHHLRRPRKNGHSLMDYKHFGKFYKQSLQQVKRKPYLSLAVGAAVVVSAISSLFVWYIRK